MIFISQPPQFGQCCMAMLKTRLSSRVQLQRLRADVEGGVYRTGHPWLWG